MNIDICELLKGIKVIPPKDLTNKELQYWMIGYTQALNDILKEYNEEVESEEDE